MALADAAVNYAILFTYSHRAKTKEMENRGGGSTNFKKRIDEVVLFFLA